MIWRSAVAGRIIDVVPQSWIIAVQLYLNAHLGRRNVHFAPTCVMARSHATEGFPTFARFGSNVLVVWDETDATADPYLHAATLLGLGLSTRGKTVGDQGDLEALRDVEGRIEDELRRLEKMEKHNEGIRKNSDGIADEIRRAQRQLDLLLRKAKSTLVALNIELHEEHVERLSPIALHSGSYAAATAALGSLPRASGE
jgi:hypothetical protein